GEEHYNLISALHKSLRGSDPDASLYWLARMLEGGEDPLYIARRLVRFASEDVGNADPRALQVAIAAKQAVEFIGMPEADLALTQAVTYLATAPKSNSLYKAYSSVKEDVKNSMTLPVPLSIRNAPTRLMKELGYGKSYRYPHIAPEAIVNQQYLPSKLKGKCMLVPSEYETKHCSGCYSSCCLWNNYFPKHLKTSITINHCSFLILNRYFVNKTFEYPNSK
ncbi:unnamed protein product, partial [marine sediment metagenome]